MAVRRADFVAFGTPVVGQFEFGLGRIAFVTEKSQAVLVVRVFGPAQQLHTQHLGVKINRALEVANAQHSVKKSHREVSRVEWGAVIVVSLPGLRRLADDRRTRLGF